MQAVILCAGKSTRTYPLTLTQPKPLLPLISRSILEWNLSELDGLVDEVILIVGYKADMIRERIGPRFGKMRVRYCEQDQQLGTGHAILQTRELVEGPFLAFNGDDVYSRVDFEQLGREEAAALVHEVENPSLYGIYEIDPSGRVVKLEEKPLNPNSNLANLGCYKFPLEIFAYLERTGFSERGEMEITTAIQMMAQDRPVQTVRRRGRWLPTGFAWDLLKNSRALWEEGAVPEWHVHPSARVAPSATLIPPVYIGPECSVGHGAIVGPYTVLEKNCIIDAGARIIRSTIMEGSRVGEASVVLDSVLGRSTRVGPAVSMLNETPEEGIIESEIKGRQFQTGLRQLGSVLGDKSAVGAGSTLWPGVKIWPDVTLSIDSKVRTDVRPEGFVWE